VFHFILFWLNELQNCLSRNFGIIRCPINSVRIHVAVTLNTLSTQCCSLLSAGKWETIVFCEVIGFGVIIVFRVWPSSGMHSKVESQRRLCFVGVLLLSIFRLQLVCVCIFWKKFLDLIAAKLLALRYFRICTASLAGMKITSLASLLMYSVLWNFSADLVLMQTFRAEIFVKWRLILCSSCSRWALFQTPWSNVGNLIIIMPRFCFAIFSLGCAERLHGWSPRVKLAKRSI